MGEEGRRRARERGRKGEGEERRERRKERVAKNKAVFILVRLQGCDVIDECEMSVEVSQDSGHISR